LGVNIEPLKFSPSNWSRRTSATLTVALLPCCTYYHRVSTAGP